MNIQKFDVSRDETIYEAWPDIVKTDGGKLFVYFPNVSIILTEPMHVLHCVKALTVAEPGHQKDISLIREVRMIFLTVRESPDLMTEELQLYVTE